MRRASSGRRRFALGAALLRRAQTLARDSARGLTARAWHLVNLPAGSDVTGCGPRSARWTARCGGWACSWRPNAAGRRPLPHPVDDPRRTPMPRVPSPQSVLDRVRRDVERNALRARNGIKLVAGVDRPGVGQTPKDVVWQRGRRQLWHYRNDERALRPAAAHRLQPDQPQLHPRPDAGEQLRRAAAGRRLRRLPARLGRARRAGRGERSRGLRRRLHPGRRSTGSWSCRGPRRSTCSATASAATSPCSTPPTTRTRRCAA